MGGACNTVCRDKIGLQNFSQKILKVRNYLAEKA